MRFFLSLSLLLLGCATVFAASKEAESAREAARQYGAAVRNCDMNWAVDAMYPPLRRAYADKLSARNEATMATHVRRFKGEQKAETTVEAAARMAANDKLLRARYAKMGEEMKAQGVRIESYTVGEPYAEYAVTPPMGTVAAVEQDRSGRVSAENLSTGNDRSRLVVLPTTLVVSTPAANGTRQRVERRSYIFAVRDEVIDDTVNVYNSPRSNDNRPPSARANVSLKRGTTLNKWYFIDGNTDANTLRTFFPDLPLYLKLPTCGDRVLR